MSQTLTVHNWCDNLAVHNENEVQAEVQRTVLDERGKPIDLDLCPDCDTIVVAVHLLALNGTPSTTTAKPRPRVGRRPAADAEREYPCPRCDYAAINRDGLGKHTRRQHDLTTSEAIHEINAAIAKQSPAPLVVEGPLPKRRKGRPPADAPKPWKCKVPRCNWPGSTSRNGLYQHILKEHQLGKAQYEQRYGEPIEETV